MLKVIQKRRSIRKYKKTDVSKEKIIEIIKAGMNAPSAGNEQPWEFIVITDRKLLDKIMEIHPYAQMLAETNTAILVCGNLAKEKHKDYWIQDCSAAVENMLLEIVNQNLGGVWLGVYPRQNRCKQLAKLFFLPENVIPFAIIALGEAAEEKPLKNEFHPDMIKENDYQTDYI